jgi:hypothetical protein
MSHLEPRERQCLARVARREGEDIGQCDVEVIQRLLSLGLIEETVDVKVPLPMVRRSLRLTVAGRAVLKEGG